MEEQQKKEEVGKEQKRKERIRQMSKGKKKERGRKKPLQASQTTEMRLEPGMVAACRLGGRVG